MTQPNQDRARRSHRQHKWPVCGTTGKRRYRDGKDVRLALKAAHHARSRAAAAEVKLAWTIQRAYRCDDCRGWHTTSQKTYRGVEPAGADQAWFRTARWARVTV